MCVGGGGGSEMNFAVALLSLRIIFAAPQNLLFIVVDDLRTELGVYGHGGLVSSPNIDKLAARGVTFSRAYCQYTLCSPSRTAFLTGMRPDRTRLWEIGPYFREQTANATAIVTLPQALKAAGYNATGAGKVWHPGTSSGGDGKWCGGNCGGDDQPYSWSYPVPAGVDPRVLFWECDAGPNTTGVSARVWGLPGAQGCITSDACVQCLESYNVTTPRSWIAAPCDDACFVDSLVSSRVAADLAGKGAAAVGGGAAPWALFAGFKRPHLGFAVPQWALDAQPLHPPLAALRAPPPGFPPSGWSGNGEINSYPDAGREGVANATFPGMLRDEAHAPLRRAYYAAVRWVDSQIGAVLDALDAAGLSESTWVVLTGDHGWSLGEHGSWAKVTLFETTARVPLIIAPPRGAAGWKTNATVGPEGIVEHLDMYPTVLDVLGVAGGVPQGQLNGASLAPLLREGGGGGSGKNFSVALTQVMRGVEPGRRCNNHPPAGGEGAEPTCAMGVSIRVPGWRFTQWVGFNYGNKSAPAAPIWGDLRGEELYDHRVDDAAAGGADPNNNFDVSEVVDVAGDPQFSAVKKALAAQLRAAWAQ